MNRSAKGLLIIITTLDGFTLANHRRFAKFAKLSTCQTFPLYGIVFCVGGLKPIFHKITRVLYEQLGQI